MFGLVRTRAFPRPRRRVLSPAVTCAALTLLVACGEGVQVKDQAMSEQRQSVAQASDGGGGAGGIARSAPAERSAQDFMLAPQRPGATAPALATPPAPPVTGASQVPAAAPANSMIIRTGHASIEVDSLDQAMRAVERATRAVGGTVGNTMLTLGEDQVRSATIELRVPSTNYDSALSGLSAIGKVESVNSTAQDVGEEFVDLNARVANSRRLEARLLSLLDNRTSRLQDALAVERELSRVREEIERVEGRVRYLSTRLAMSSITLSLHERVPIVRGTPGSRILADALKDAWRNFVGLSAAFIASLGILVPVGLVAALAAAWWRRRRAERLLVDLRASQQA
ncbi:MAG: DUF4349 domain-containing protein [Gemmatimonadota bacterium]